MRVSSLRARLTLWYTAIIAVPLLLFVAGSYALLARTMLWRTQGFLDEALAAFSSELHSEFEGFPTVGEAVQTALYDVQFHDLQVVVLDRENRIIGTRTPLWMSIDSRDDSDRVEPLRLEELRDSLAHAPWRSGVAFSLPGASGGYRVSVRVDSLQDKKLRLAGVYPLYRVERTMRDTRVAYAIAVPAFLLIAATGAWFLAKRNLAPLGAMRDQALTISSSTLHERLPVATPDDEIGGVAVVINGLLERLERAFAQQRQFMADASHELRTPVAILRAETDVTLRRDHREESEYRASMTVMRTAALRLDHIVSDVFFVARADAGELTPERTPVYFDEIVIDVCRALRPIADRAGVSLAVGTVHEASVLGDTELLTRLASNLVDNAIKFSPAGAPVEVDLTRMPNERCALTVVNGGERIPPDMAERIFERFFQVDRARSRREGRDGRKTGGAGLGLAIAKFVADSHGGRLDLVSSRPGRTEFRVELPLLDAANGT